MIRFFSHVLALLFLLTLQVSFVHALPYPFDRIPLVLVVSIYLYQYVNQRSCAWWLVAYGLVLDILSLSLAPLQSLSYLLIAGTMMLLVAHVFTNRSFYGMAATSLLCLAVLTLSELAIVGLSHILTGELFLWKPLLLTNLWAALFSCLLLLFVFSSLRRVRLVAQQLFLDRP
ncbi:hypothetical protein HY630_00835 [Candidatus Uhrbacteria bacterium]|nr:hypothetical protein [Candidatus Uhrbacteria bacterium]